MLQIIVNKRLSKQNPESHIRPSPIDVQVLHSKSRMPYGRSDNVFRDWKTQMPCPQTTPEMVTVDRGWQGRPTTWEMVQADSKESHRGLVASVEAEVDTSYRPSFCLQQAEQVPYELFRQNHGSQRRSEIGEATTESRTACTAVLHASISWVHHYAPGSDDVLFADRLAPGNNCSHSLWLTSAVPA